MSEYISDKLLLKITYKFIYDNNDKLGIPIGNYTSQYFANIYLDKLDKYIKEILKVFTNNTIEGKKYMNYYNEIKNELINNEITKRIKDYSKNRSDLNTCYNVGKLLFDAGKNYGESIIKEYSKKLTN